MHAYNIITFQITPDKFFFAISSPFFFVSCNTSASTTTINHLLAPRSLKIYLGVPENPENHLKLIKDFTSPAPVTNFTIFNRKE